jgi:hypothetical protein
VYNAIMVHSSFTAAFTPGAHLAGDDGESVEVVPHVIGELKVPSGRISVSDPLTTAFDRQLVALARRAPTGVFPVEVAVARFTNGDLRVACARVRFDRDASPTRWEIARFEDDPPDDAGAYGVDAGTGSFYDLEARGEIDEATSDAWLAALETHQVETWSWHVADLGAANVAMFSSGWGDGFYASWWGLDGDRVIELVTDFELLFAPLGERVEVPLPLPRGRRIHHPLLDKHEVTVSASLFSRTAVTLSGRGTARVELSDGSPVTMTRRRGKRRYTWKSNPPDVRLVVRVMVGLEPHDVVPPSGAGAK